MFFDPEGKAISAEEWERRKDDWLPSAADRAFVKSLQARAIVEHGKMANWIAAPPRGINGRPSDFQYVRAEE
jgi:benzoyl-CoA 2,3-dioxygenase component B